MCEGTGIVSYALVFEGHRHFGTVAADGIAFVGA
jgi:hypothetical protein